MRSSISDSRSAALTYAKVLVGFSIVLIVALEILAHSLLKHHSVTYARVSQQYAEAAQARRARLGEPTSVLLVGNSLLMDGVDVDRLQQLMSSSLRVYPVFLEATAYYDWLYGLRRLFRQGARPQVVVVGLSVNSFLEDAVRQEYSPMMFFDVRDILGVASDLGLDRTATSNLLLAHSSAFWDTRSVIRTQILSHMIPHFKDLFSLVKTKPAIPLGPAFEPKAISRLRSLRELCEAHGAKLIIVVPPTPSSESAVRRLASASRKVGVETLVPLDPKALSAKFYQPDALHLNLEGATLFTAALATDLPKRIVVRQTLDSPD